eukprot:CAMPEP_0119518596 /NCGR_PEP_ID=MMETSP1344-20130328/35160_1 /TAXON_ID=236787 /ORGANISM="Florenciella parvula, Strain CCMP2471" /LENGTH=151 /DNA_ID=CAMNT_0007556303 /DNA_START=71 /DNA_END=522 /DNA_ORIENTATION=-
MAKEGQADLNTEERSDGDADAEADAKTNADVEFEGQEMKPSPGHSALGFKRKIVRFAEGSREGSRIADDSRNQEPELFSMASPALPSKPSTPAVETRGSCPVLLLVLQHFLIVTPIGLILLWSSWPYVVCRRTLLASDVSSAGAFSREAPL